MTHVCRLVLASVGFMFLCASCAPKVYIIDRPTLLEAEAAGAWPDLEEAVELRSLSLKPQPLPASAKKVDQKKPYRIIAGEFQLSKTSVQSSEATDETKADGDTK